MHCLYISILIISLAGPMLSTINAQQPAHDTKGLVESKMLRKELNSLVATMLKAAKQGKFAEKLTDKTGKTTTYVPPIWVPSSKSTKPIPFDKLTPEKLTAVLIRHYRKLDPNFLRVNPEMEKRWKAGMFNDAKTRKHIEAAMKFYREFNIALPKMHAHLLEKRRFLQGAKLQLAAHIFDAHIAQIQHEMKGVTKRHADRTKIIQALLGLKAEVAYDRKTSHIFAIDFSRTKLQDGDLKIFAELAKHQMPGVLKHLELDRTKITDKGLQYLRHLQGVQSLDLEFTAITDKGLAHIRHIKSLRELDLERTNVSAAGLKYLHEMKQLQKLDLRNTKVNEDDINAIQNLKKRLPDARILTGSNRSRGIRKPQVGSNIH